MGEQTRAAAVRGAESQQGSRTPVLENLRSGARPEISLEGKEGEHVLVPDGIYLLTHAQVLDRMGYSPGSYEDMMLYRLLQWFEDRGMRVISELEGAE